jgi:hypothetical protein
MKNYKPQDKNQLCLNFEWNVGFEKKCLHQELGVINSCQSTDQPYLQPWLPEFKPQLANGRV